MILIVVPAPRQDVSATTPTHSKFLCELPDRGHGTCLFPGGESRDPGGDRCVGSVAHQFGVGHSRLVKPRSPFEKDITSVALGLLFLVHPLQSYVTLYIWQRMALMACFFYYASLAAFLAVRIGKIRNQAAGYGLCLGLFVCALLSKENTVTLPVSFIMAEIAFFREGGLALVKRAAAYLAILVIVAGTLSIPAASSW